MKGILMCHICRKEACSFDDSFIDWKKFDETQIICYRCFHVSDNLEDLR